MAELEVKFNKGLNSAIDFMTDAPGHCLTFADYQLDYGILRPRTSMTAINSSAIGSSTDQLDGIYYWVDPAESVGGGGGTGFLYVNDSTSGKFYRFSPGAGTFTDITNAVAQNSAPLSFASLNGILVFTGASGSVIKITSHTANCALLGTNPVNFSILRTVNNMMFGAILGGGSTFYWSAVGDPTTWPGGSNLTFRNNDGDSIVALGELNGQLLIFKYLSIGLLQTTSQTVSGTVTLGPLSTLFQGIGASGPNAVDNLPDGRCVFFASDANMYVTDGSTLQCLTKNSPFGPQIREATGAIIQSFTPPFVPSVNYFPYRREVWLSGISPGTGNPYCFAYDIDQQYWRKITGINPYAVTVAKNFYTSSIQGQDSIIFAGNNLGRVVNIVNGNTSVPGDQTSRGGVTNLVTPDVSASVVIPQNFFNGDTVCLTILYKGTSGGVGNTVSYRYGFDGTYGSSRTFLAGNNRVDLKIALTALSNSQRPTTFQINFQDNGNSFAGASIYRVILSDEVTA